MFNIDSLELMCKDRHSSTKDAKEKAKRHFRTRKGENTMFTKANINWNTNQLVKMISNGRITFDNAVQRGLVWKNDQKSLLIHSMLTGYPIPALYARKGDDKTYDMLDGKQRCSTIVEFKNDEFELTELAPIVTEDGEEVDITGKTYSELSDDFKDIINNYSLTVYYFDNMTDD